MKKLFLFLCLLQAISFADKIKMAVFQVDSKLLGVDQSKLVSEMLTAECAKNSQYEVVPWQEVGNALKLASDKSRVGELSSKNANIECTNSKCFDALGSLDVRYMVTARVEKPGQKLRMTLKLTDVETMKQVNILSTSADNVDVLLDDLPNLTVNLLGGTAADADARAQALKLSQQKRQDSIAAYKAEQARLAQLRQDSIQVYNEQQTQLAKQAELERQQVESARISQQKEDSVNAYQLELDRLKKNEIEKKRQAKVQAEKTEQLRKSEEQKQREQERRAKETQAQSAVTAATQSSSSSSNSILVPSLRWGGAGLVAVGSFLAISGNSDMDAAYDAKSSAVSTNDSAAFESAKADSKSAASKRTTGLGVAVLGLLSFGLSFAF